MAFTMQAQLTAEQRVQKAVVTIMNNERYYALAGVLMIGSKEIVEDVPTAATNGRDEYYGRAFVDGISDAQLRFVILHECYHKLFRHLTTWKHLHDEDHRLANMACDYVINLIIRDENPDGFVELFDWICIDDAYAGMNAEEVYNILKQNRQRQQRHGPDIRQDGGQGGGQGGGQEDGVLDDHDWEGAQEMSEEEQGELAEQIDNAIRQGAITAGKMGSGGNRAIDSMMQPEVDWVDVLREFATETCRGRDYSTYARPNRRYLSSGRYMPSGVSEHVGELIISIDTSASIGQPELTKFLSEVQGVVENVNPEKIRLLYWDTKVCADEVYEADEVDKLIESTKPAGGGGTEISCVNKYLTEEQINPQAVIVFTDGYLGGDWGTWNCPVLWCILDHQAAQPTVGTAVHVKL
jgi:predicted metal-dependent peptidase